MSRAQIPTVITTSTVFFRRSGAEMESVLVVHAGTAALTWFDGTALQLAIQRMFITRFGHSNANSFAIHFGTGLLIHERRTMLAAKGVTAFEWQRRLAS
ncbi:hypothetical protein [Archangium violaceum]|uniref:hypothetical protein n=1 Tax=Archangium violaceum TaxID=83451 RepID=UPI0037C02240